VQPDHANGWWVVSLDPEGDDCIDASGDGGFNEDVARLISAAPDMLEALRKLIDALDGERTGQDGNEKPSRSPRPVLAMSFARAAIAKATGEEG
jgi:hypothetical protein